MTYPYSFSVRPVFIYGALRSGTTLLRLMLDAHPGISNPGEKDCLFDHLGKDPTHPTGWRYDRAAMKLDRMFRATELTLHEDVDGLDLLDQFLQDLADRDPGVPTINIHRNIARVTQLMPQVKLVHLLRDPRDVAHSSVRMGWAGTGWHAAGHWQQTEAEWDAITPALSQDQVLTLRFEDLFKDLDGHLHSLCDFIGVPFDPTMHDYHIGSSYAAPNPKLAYQWRKRAPSAEIAQVETRLGALMVARGYELSGPAKNPGKLERWRLGLQNKWRIWRVGMRRYGVTLYLGEKLSRWMGLNGLHTKLKLQIDARTTHMLK